MSICHHHLPVAMFGGGVNNLYDDIVGGFNSILVQDNHSYFSNTQRRRPTRIWLPRIGSWLWTCVIKSPMKATKGKSAVKNSRSWYKQYLWFRAHNVVTALLKRLAHRYPNVQLYTLSLTDALSKNCGVAINKEIASRAFTQSLEKLVADRVGINLNCWTSWC